MTKKKPAKKNDPINPKKCNVYVNVALYDGLLCCYSELLKILSIYGKEAAELSPAIRHVLANKDNMGAFRFVKDLERAHIAVGTYDDSDDDEPVRTKKKTDKKGSSKKKAHQSRGKKISSIIDKLAAANTDILVANRTPLVFLNEFELFNRVNFLVKEVLGLDNDVTHDETASDLGMDSLDSADLSMAFEEEFNVEITDEVMDMLTVLNPTMKEIVNIFMSMKRRRD